MIALDRNADTFPVGLAGTPFEEVYRALRVVAASVWAVDPTVYRAGMAWGWYALHAPSALFGFRDVVTAALISEMAPMVKASQTDAELVEYLRQWREYTPTFPKLQALYALFGVAADIQPISDPEGQALLPVDDTRLAFYIFVLSMDWSRPMLLGEIAETARSASPLGARPFIVYLVEGFASVPVAIAPTDGFLWVDVWESAVPVAPPGPVLPTVETATGQYNNGNYNTSLSSGYGFSTKVAYDDSKLYCASAEKFDYSDGTYYGLPVRNSSGIAYVYNKTGATISLKWWHLYSVDLANTAVVTVFDTFNNPYNAFMHTASGTDYYYVLDGTQTDWTDNLSSIGYRPSIIGYFSSSGESATANTSISASYWNALYKDVGGYMEGDQSKTYTPMKAIKADGTILNASNGYMQCVLYTGLLNIQFKPASSTSAHHLVFIES